MFNKNKKRLKSRFNMIELYGMAKVQALKNDFRKSCRKKCSLSRFHIFARFFVILGGFSLAKLKRLLSAMLSATILLGGIAMTVPNTAYAAEKILSRA